MVQTNTLQTCLSYVIAYTLMCTHTHTHTQMSKYTSPSSSIMLFCKHKRCRRGLMTQSRMVYFHFWNKGLCGQVYSTFFLVTRILYLRASLKSQLLRRYFYFCFLFVELLFQVFFLSLRVVLLHFFFFGVPNMLLYISAGTQTHMHTHQYTHTHTHTHTNANLWP